VVEPIESARRRPSGGVIGVRVASV